MIWYKRGSLTTKNVERTEGLHINETVLKWIKKFWLIVFLIGMTGCKDVETEVWMEEEFALEEETPSKEESEEVSEEAVAEIYVDVCGAVVNPGVVVLESGSRVYQAIEAAGGFLPEARKTAVNQAQGLTDGQQIYVPSEEEAAELQTEEAVGGSEDQKVDLNTADESQLTTLPGIGISKAQAIIAYREENGPFSVIEDVMKVQGIKESVYAKIQDDIVVR